ncbi:MAG: adenosylmethionine decarboxylase [Deltaproteobacteria bacterium]|nr:adenosylmethionine decarboxylase [Deltaproteobacteria bacterium]
MIALGRHCICEFYDCDTGLLNNIKYLKSLFTTCAKDAGATVVKVVFHKFSPHGVSGVVIIAESHLSVHTWPEFGYAAVDVFTCGPLLNNTKIAESLKEGLKAKKASVTMLQRGILSADQKVVFN